MSKQVNFHDFLVFLSGVLHTPELELETSNLSDVVNFDSMGKIEVAEAIEERFGWRVPQEELSSCSSSKELFDLVVKNAVR